MNKFTLISYLVLLVVAVFALNKFVHLSKNFEEKILGSYYTQMEEVNRESGMEVYNLGRQAYSQEELEILKEIY